MTQCYSGKNQEADDINLYAQTAWPQNTLIKNNQKYKKSLIKILITRDLTYKNQADAVNLNIIKHQENTMIQQS